ncbi:MAG: hypothetical protein HY537_13045 [Deltaproteobacteria bacterium]|nr:hypothetical protein [Deltaproteobacteria bacterium]
MTRAFLLLSVFFSFSLTANQNSDAILRVLLDARCGRIFKLKNSHRVQWPQFTGMGVDRGRLLDDAQLLADKLARKGVHPSKEIWVVGGGKRCWGEEGRIGWMLQYLGVENVKVVGEEQFDKMKKNIQFSPGQAPKWLPQIKSALRASLIDLHKSGRLKEFILIDARGHDEWLGAPKYMLKRGGHIAESINIQWDSFFDSQSHEVTVERIQQVMARNSISKDAKILVYCTVGVRSGFMVYWLRQAGFLNAANDDASLWAYSRNPALPLVKQ